MELIELSEKPSASPPTEGQLFGLPNQMLGVFTAIGLVTISISSVVLWWRRRPEKVLQERPCPDSQAKFGPMLVVVTIALGIYLPMFAASLLAVWLVERLLLRRLPRACLWLGLSTTARENLHPT